MDGEAPVAKRGGFSSSCTLEVLSLGGEEGLSLVGGEEVLSVGGEEHRLVGGEEVHGGGDDTE
jgi:hypothetical protein